MPALLTVGVYDWDLDHFLGALTEARVRLLLDVRQRRGVRGPQYAWANARRLQAALAAADVGYRHLPELAPTTELRHLQYAEDARQGVGKRSRVALAPAYVARYTEEILDCADIDSVIAVIRQAGTAALFCVERDPEACHRSLVAARIGERAGIRVTHLRPG